jgi:hypothetical protein
MMFYFISHLLEAAIENSTVKASVRVPSTSSSNNWVSSHRRKFFYFWFRWQNSIKQSIFYIFESGNSRKDIWPALADFQRVPLQSLAWMAKLHQSCWCFNCFSNSECKSAMKKLQTSD